MAFHATPLAPHETGWDVHFRMFSPRFIASCVAAALLEGAWNERRMCARAVNRLGGKPRALVPLVRRVLLAFPDRNAVGLDGLTEFLLQTRGFIDDFKYTQIHQISWPDPAMQPGPRFIAGEQLPAIASPAQLADWLGLTLPQL